MKLVLNALQDGTALSRKVLVMFVVQRLVKASKTSIGALQGSKLIRQCPIDLCTSPMIINKITPTGCPIV